MSAYRNFGRYLQHQIDWEDEGFMREALELYVAAINEAATGWFPRSFRAWFGWFGIAMLLGAMAMGLILLLIAYATGGLQP